MTCNCKRLKSAEELNEVIDNTAKKRLSFFIKAKAMFGFFLLQNVVMYSSIWNFMVHDRLEPTVPRKLIRFLFRNG